MKEKQIFSAETYRGWTITFDDARPVTGKFRSERFGVTMSAGSLDAAKRQVDQRLIDYPPRGD